MFEGISKSTSLNISVKHLLEISKIFGYCCLESNNCGMFPTGNMHCVL
jgi:hypothetical protein